MQYHVGALRKFKRQTDITSAVEMSFLPIIFFLYDSSRNEMFNFNVVMQSR